MTLAIAIGLCSGCNLFKYFDKKVNVYREKDVVDKQISLRYYFKQMHVPYIEVNEYYKEFFNIELNFSKSNKEYKYALSDNEYISFNVESNELSILGLSSFAGLLEHTSENEKFFLHLDETNKGEEHLKTIDLDKYSINFYEENDQIYAPLSLLSKFSGGLSLYNVAYNGKDVYVLDYDSILFSEERTTDYYGDKYSKKFSNIFFRNKDMAKYSYNELCFVFDNFRGETEKLIFGEEKFKELGLDGYLSTYYPELKECLLATGRRKYGAGILSLFFGLDDGGHTGLLSYYPFLLVSLFTKVTGSESLSELYHKVVDRDNDYEKVYSSCNFYRNTSLGTPGDYYYYLEQDSETAYIGFNSFDVDYNGWDNYYNAQGSVPVETDTFAFVRDKLYKAKSGGAKNIILDLSTNGGGDTNALSGLVGLFNKAKSNLTFKDTFNNYLITDNFSVDINLDGIFDEQDALECQQFDFNIGVLTSRCSFSCGNLFPYMMSNLGYMLVGEQSGGGSCAISIETTAEGIGYARSSHLTLVDSNGDNIDKGIPVDYQIELKDSEYVDYYDASEFYNCSLMRQYLEEFYSNN